MSSESRVVVDPTLRDLITEAERLRDVAESVRYQMKQLSIKIQNRIDELTALDAIIDLPASRDAPRQ